MSTRDPEKNKLYAYITFNFSWECKLYIPEPSVQILTFKIMSNMTLTNFNRCPVVRWQKMS